jgi:transposase-like protein
VYANELPDNAVTVNGTVRHPKRNFTEAEIQSLVTNYRDNGLTVYQLADKYGCHRNTISKVLRQNGVEVTIRKLNEERLKQAIELYGAGWSLREIGRELDVTKSTVRVALVKAEVEMREAKRCKVNGNMLDSG